MGENKTVGVVGVGLLGNAIAGVLLDAGCEVIGYDVVPECVARLVARGGRAAGSPAEVARASGPVFAVLPTLDSVEDAIVGQDGILDGATAETVIVQMSTISPELAVGMEEAARSRGVAFLDAPVSGTSFMVSRRDCVVTAGGDREAFDRTRWVLDALAKRVFHVGPCGAGSYVKLVTNLIMGLNGVVVAEGLTLARRAGIDPAQMVEILSHGAAASKMLEVRGPRMVEGRFEPMMKVDLYLKDVRLMLEAAQALHVPLPLTSVMQQLYTAAYAGGQPKDDLAGIIRLYERMAGLDARATTEKES